MESDSVSPSFEKTMTHIMLQKNGRVKIPANFIRTHGHMLETDRVVSMTGPNGQMCRVEIKPYPRVRGSGQTESRFFLGPGWKEFVKENGFQVGDNVLFRLVGSSCFHVLVSSKLQENVKYPGPDAAVSSKPRFPQFIRKLSRSSLRSRDNRLLQENVKHPGPDADVSSKPRFPQFIRKLSRSSLSSRDSRLELPYHFAKKFGHKFQERVCLLGPNGQWRVVKIRIWSSCSSPIRVQFRDGWKSFSVENGFKEGDVLLFSLVGFSKFLVQVSPAAAQ